MADDSTSRTDGAGAPATAPLQVTMIADRYRVVEIASTGANTMVVDAVDTNNNQPVTVKVIRPALAATEGFARAFRRQIETATALSHPNLAKVLDWGEVEVDGQPTWFWVVEYLNGGSMRNLFDRGRLLDPSQALVVGLEACRGLDAAHQRGLVHSEITPSKLVFGDDRRLRIIDFGTARLLGVAAWDDPATMPTHVARYASPEQALNLPVDAKTDVYALSLCLIEAVTGSVPFAGDSTVSTLAARVGKLMPVSADLGPLASVLERAGRPEAEDRFTASEFGRALVGAAEKLPRPEPIPIIATSLFAASDLRRPTDPTGEPARPEVVETVVEPDDETLDDPVTEEAATEEAVTEEAATEDAVTGDAVIAEGVADDNTGDDETGDDETVDDRPTEPIEALDDAADVAETDDVDGTGAPIVATAAAAAAVTAAAASTEAPTAPPTAPASLPSSSPPAAPVSPPSSPPDGPLIVLTDIADEPLDVAAGSAASGPSATEAVPSAPAAGPATLVAPTVPPTPPPPTPFDEARDPSGEIYDAAPRRRRILPIVLITLVVLVGIAGLSYAGYQLVRTKSFEVPDLVGVQEEVALNAIAGNDWNVLTAAERSDAQPVPGDVIRTEPEAGVDLEEGEDFLLVISEGPELRTLPDLENLELAAAQQQLDDLRLVLVEAPEAFSEDVPAGSIIMWQVEDNASLVAGAQVLPDTRIVVTVSKGPEPRPAPALAGLNLEQATAAVNDLQLVLAEGEAVFSDTIEPGLIVTQNPAPETPVERGGTVTVQVSKGPDIVALPDLTGLSFDEAQTLLTDNGFFIDSLLGTTTGTFVSLTINGEPVEPGTTFPRGTGVDVIFL
ncbi:MAG: PASTA domain-containing protein [Actinomycetota bacterium]